VADLQQIDSFLNDLSSQAAAWYSIVTNRPAVVPGSTPAFVDLQASAGVTPPPAPLPLLSVVQSPDVLPLLLLVAGVVVLALLLKD